MRANILRINTFAVNPRTAPYLIVIYNFIVGVFFDQQNDNVGGAKWENEFVSKGKKKIKLLYMKPAPPVTKMLHGTWVLTCSEVRLSN